MENFRNQNYNQPNLHASQNLHFECKGLNIDLPSTSLLTFVATNVYLLLFLAIVLNISIVLLYRSLNELNALSICHKIIAIDIAFRIC